MNIELLKRLAGIIPKSKIADKEVKPKDTEFQREIDYTKTADPAEILGRSQLINVNLPNTKSSNVSKEDVERILKDYLKNDEYEIHSYRALFDNLDKLDYENIETHLKHIKTFFNMASNYQSATIENGYFYSKEGAEAFDILADKYSARAKSGFVSPLSNKLRVYDVKTILKARDRGLLDSLENKKLIERLTAMSDEEFTTYQNRINEFWNNSNKDYETCVSELNNKLIRKLDPENSKKCIEFVRDNTTRGNVTAQLELMDVLENISVEMNMYEYFSLLGNADIDNVSSKIKVINELTNKEDFSKYNLTSLSRITNQNTENVILEALKIDDVSLSKLLEIIHQNPDFEKGTVSTEELLNQINNDSMIKTMRTIRANSDKLRQTPPPTQLNPHDIDSSALALVHMTDYEPENGVILSTRDKIGGSRNSVHFTLNHAVTSHRAGDWDGCKYAIVMPYDSAKEKNTPHKFIEGMPNDLYTDGSVKIPEGAIIVHNNPDIPKGEIKITTHPTIKGTKVVETSENVHGIVPSILEAIGYKHLKADSAIGQFNFGEKKGKSMEDVVTNYKAWEKFCDKEGMKTSRHTGSPGGIAEAMIEDVAKLCANDNGWNGRNFNYKKLLLHNIEELKNWQSKGYFVSFDLDKFKELLLASETPQDAVDNMKKTLGFIPTVKYDEFYASSIRTGDLSSYVSYLDAVEQGGKVFENNIQLEVDWKN